MHRYRNLAELNPGRSFDTDLSWQRLLVQNVQDLTDYTGLVIWPDWPVEKTLLICWSWLLSLTGERTREARNNLLYGVVLTISQMIRNPWVKPYGIYWSNDHILHCIHTGLNIGGGPGEDSCIRTHGGGMKMYGVQQGGGSKSAVFCVRNIWMAPIEAKFNFHWRGCQIPTSLP